MDGWMYYRFSLGRSLNECPYTIIFPLFVMYSISTMYMEKHKQWLIYTYICFNVGWFYRHAWPCVAMCNPGHKPEIGNNPSSFQIVSRVLYPTLNQIQLCTAPSFWNSRAALYKISFCSWLSHWQGLNPCSPSPPPDSTSRTRVPCLTSWAPQHPFQYNAWCVWSLMYMYVSTYMAMWALSG